MSYLDDAERFVNRRLVEDERRGATVYVVEALGLERIKIGTARDVVKRLQTLQCASPVELVVIGQISGGHFTEKWLHYRLKQYSIRGEWFRLDCPWRQELDLIGNLRTSAKQT
jgi:hypothetical protein